MFQSIIRNYKNAGVKASVSLCVQAHPDQYDFSQVFSHAGTGLDLHNLATKGHRELLRQASASLVPRRRGETFEEIAWHVAASSLFSSVPRLRTCSPEQMGMAVPYLCFLAEYLSKEWQANEARDIFISRTGEVTINSFAGLDTKTKVLGNFKA